MKRPALSIALALGASLLMTVTAAASSTYTDWIHGSELPNATPTEGQFVGEATGSFAGAWYIDVKHQDLSHHPAYITGGSFRLNTVINGWPDAIHGSFTPGMGRSASSADSPAAPISAIRCTGSCPALALTMAPAPEPSARRSRTIAPTSG